jgi:3-hydroxyisobutyrate dehydrogenase-like beta-hydroxyacid dehydrogenase
VRQIGIIGLGLVGTAIAQRLLRGGTSVVGFDLADLRREGLELAGGRAVDSALAVAQACDLVVLSLPNSDVVGGVIDELQPALRAGTTIVDTTTGDPEAAAVVGARLAELSVQYLDATIVGSSAQVSDGQVVVMVGGEVEALDAARAVLETFASQTLHVGPWGAGSRMKLVVNLVLGLNRAVLAEGITLARALGVDPERALDVLRASAAYSRVMDTKGPKMLAEDFAPQARLAQHLKDVQLMLAAAERTGTDLPLSLLHRELLERVVAAGDGDLDNSAIIRAFRPAPPK